MLVNNLQLICWHFECIVMRCNNSWLAFPKAI